MAYFSLVFLLSPALSMDPCPTGYVSDPITGDCDPCTEGCLDCSSLPTPGHMHCVGCSYPEDAPVEDNCIKPCNALLSCNSNCIAPCLTCGQMDNSICGSCVDGFYLENQTCVTVCSPGRYLSASICVNCPLECATCTATGCLSCPSGVYLDGYTCVSSCSSSQYVLAGVCVNCNTGCVTCSQVGCLSCTGGLYLSGLQCVPACSSSQYLSGTVCIDCPSSCQTCSSAGCVSCPAGLYISNFQCVSVCNSSQYATNMQCIDCAASCSTCSSVGCLSCLPSLYLSNHQCVSVCGSSQYISASVCVDCDPTCSTCSVVGCLSCVSGLFLSNYQCVATCGSAQYLALGQCLDCPTLCASCSAAGCQSCQAGSYLESNSCVSACGSRQYISAGKCLDCGPDCATCSALGCLSCVSGLYLYQYQCVASCSSSQYISSGNCIDCASACATCSMAGCISCQVGTYLYSNSCISACGSTQYVSLGKCIDCDSSCASCVAAGCLSCASNLYLSGYQCVLSCGVSQYISAGQCLDCATGCATCTAEGCLTCQSGLYLSGFTCVSGCTSTQYVSGFLCLPCDSSCLACSSLGCLSCISGLYLSSHHCVSTCSNAQYSAHGQCIDCDISCASCSVLGCLSCQSGLFLSNYSCVATCSSAQYESAGNCVDCSPLCATCSAIGCLSCSSGLLSYQYQCLSACSGSQYTSAGSCIDCDSSCASCSSSGCLSCSPGLYYYQHQCVPVCSSSQYVSSGNCIDCDVTCLTCAAVGCLSCATGLYLSNYQCVSTCGSHQYVSSTGICQACAVMCSTCSEAGCLSCPSTSYLSHYQCISACSESQYSVPGLCIDCPTSCATCTPAGCLSCQPSLYLSGFLCVSSCSTSQYISGQQCIDCPSPCLTCSLSACLSCGNGLFLNANTCVIACNSNQYPSLGQCIDCPPTCATCTQNNCLTCLSGMFLSGTLCVSACSPHQFPVSGQCEECPTLCSSCSIAGCLSCQAGLYLSHSQCVSVCGSNQYASSNLCIDCASSCLTCSSIGCLTCQSGLYFYNNQCGNTCSGSQYSSLNQCMDCDPSCLTCSAPGCQSCLPGLSLYGYLCVPTCPNGQYSLAGHCQVCPSTCVSCTVTGCTICAAGLFMAVDGCFPPICGDGHVVSGEECDDGVNAPGSACVHCKIASPCILPTLLSAQWNRDYSGFSLQYSQRIERNATGCDIFAEKDWLGNGAVCIIQDAEVTVQLGTAPRLHLPLVLHIQPGSLLGYFCPYMTNLAVIVSDNGPIGPLEVTIVGPNQVSPCDLYANFTLQLSLSVQLQGLSSTIWTLSQLVNGHWQFLPAQTVDIQATSSPLLASFPPTNSPGQYSLAAQSWTWTGESASTVWEFEILERGRVSINVGMGQLVVRTEEQLTFRAEIEANWTCLGIGTNQEIAISWALLSNSTRLSTLNPTLTGNPYGRILPLPAYFFHPDETATILVSAQLASLPNSLIWTSFSLRCQCSPLYAIVDKTQVHLGQGQILVLDASESYRPGSTLNITYQWYCLTNAISNSQQALLSLQTGSWSPGMYECSVVVKDDLGSATATVIVEITTSPPSSSPYLLSLLQGRPLGTLQPCQLWLWASPYSTAEVSPSTSAEIVSDPARSRIELVRKLEPVEEVIVNVTTDTAVLSLRIETAGAPFGGEVEVLPEVGVAFVTDYRVCANDWIGEGKKYQYLYEGEGGDWVALTDFVYWSCVTLPLPQGHGDTFLVRVGVKVCSQWEACGFSWAVVGSQPWTYALGPSATLTDAANTLLLRAGDYEILTRAVLLLAPSLPIEPTVQITECLCFHGGHCDNGKCMCPEDWTGVYCQVLVRDVQIGRVVGTMLGNWLQQAVLKLPATAPMLEFTLRAIWTLMERGETYISEQLDNAIMAYLTSQRPYIASDWVYTDIVLRPVPLTRASSSLLANIAAASLSRSTPLYPAVRLELLREALTAKATKSLLYEGRTDKVIFGSVALPLMSVISTWNFPQSLWTNITFAVNNTAEPLSFTYIISTVVPTEWKAAIAPVVLVDMLGQWSGQSVPWQWVSLHFNSTARDSACGQWNGTLWDQTHCFTSIEPTIVCTCSQGHFFTLIQSQEPILSYSHLSTQANVFPWIPLITYCALTFLCLGGLCLGWLKDSSDSSHLSAVQSLSNSASNSDIVSGDNPLSGPRSKSLTLLQAFQDCHTLLALFYRFDRSVSRPSRVLLYLCRLTTMSAMILQMQELPEWIPWIGLRCGLVLACIQVFTYLISSLLLRLLKTYPEDAVSAVSLDSKVNMVQVLKHSPQIKLFERREDLPSVQPFEPIPPLPQGELQLSPCQRIRSWAGLVVTVVLIAGAGLAHSELRTDIRVWTASFPALAGLDCLVVQSLAVLIQYWAIKDYSLGCLLLSRSLRSLKS